MKVQALLEQVSPKIAGGVVATSLAAGLALGVWLKLPAYLAEPVFVGEPELVTADDPGRTRWAEVIGSLGGLAATFAPPPVYYETASTGPAFDDRELDRIVAEVDQQIRASEKRLASWSNDDDAWRRDQQERLARIEDRYASDRDDEVQPPTPEPALESPTTAEADEPQPPPPPRPELVSW